MLMQCIGRPQVARLARSINKHYDNFILALALALALARPDNFLARNPNGITVVLSAKRSTGRHKVAAKRDRAKRKRERVSKNTSTMRIRVRNYLVLDCAQTGDCLVAEQRGLRVDPQQSDSCSGQLEALSQMKRAAGAVLIQITQFITVGEKSECVRGECVRGVCAGCEF